MDLIDRMRELAVRAEKQLEYCLTEEATKNALVLPFINALGYDVFNPLEVVPEYTADVGIKKGEKVDYAVYQNGSPVIFIECKWSGAELNLDHAGQLLRYFNIVPSVRFAVLTNGVLYEFYSDLDTPNVMDRKPFFTFDLFSFEERHIAELKKFSKSIFDLDHILATASELKYTAAIKSVIARDFESPSDEYVNYLARQVYSGRLTAGIREQFGTLAQQAMRRFLTDQINERLRSALEESSKVVPAPTVTPEASEVERTDHADDFVIRSDKERGIYTTEDEIEAFFAVKSILRGTIDPRRIHMRDTKSYCGILLDDNNRKPLCRLRFNREKRYISLVDKDKNEEYLPIEDIEDIYSFSERIISVAEAYEK